MERRLLRGLLIVRKLQGTIRASVAIRTSVTGKWLSKDG
jgi:hypothetical protein